MQTFIPGKDAALESTIETMQAKLAARGFKLNESSLLHEVDGIWSTHMKDNDCPMLFSNGKGATELAARATISGPTSTWARRAPTNPSCITRKNAGSRPAPTANGRPGC